MKGANPAAIEFSTGLPTDDELVVHCLCRKCAGQNIFIPIIIEIDLYKFDPCGLAAMALYGEKEWYFFSPRDRKYPNGCAQIGQREPDTGRRPEAMGCLRLWE